MKDRICSIFVFLLPVAIISAILVDGLTLQTAQHSGTQTLVNHQ